MTYYIETSIGSVCFNSPDINNIIIKHPSYVKELRQHISPCNEIQFNKFLEMYEYDNMRTTQTPYGTFLIINLSDGFYGNPEYKIFKSD